MCLFPSGISYNDMDEMSSQKRIPAEWRVLLFSLLKCKIRYDDEESKSEGAEGSTPTPNPTPYFTPSGDDGVPTKFGKDSFKPDSYIWLNIQKDPVTDEIIFVPT